MKVDIVIVSNATLNKQLTIDAINSVHESDSFDFNVIVMEQTKARFENATTINYDFDFNYNKCLNEGAKYGSAKYIVFCNNDLLFEKDWFNRLLDVFEMGYKSLSPFEKRHCKSHNIKQGDHLIEGYIVRRQLFVVYSNRA